MFVSEIALRDFRNYFFLRLRFSKKHNLIIGNNAQGKTSLLEAIYFATHLRSFRTTRPADLLRKGADFFNLGLRFEEEELSHFLEIKWKQKEKKIFLDHKPIAPAEFKKNQLKILLLNNNDVMLTKAQPSVRRYYFDDILSSLKLEYGASGKEYKRLLHHRNLDLKNQRGFNRWDEPLANLGVKIINARMSFLKAIKKPLENIFYELMGRKIEKACVRYKALEVTREVGWSLTEEVYLKNLRESRVNDLRFKSTQYGPHRDDFLFLIGQRDLLTRASQGECRIFAYALKFAIFEYVCHFSRNPPIILLDDIFSDLDSHKISLFLKFIHKASQFFLACANHRLLGKEAASFEMFEIVNGGCQKSKTNIDRNF